MSIFGLITTTFNIVSEIRISEREIKDFRNRSMEEAKLKLKVLVDTISSSMEGKTLEEMGVVLKTTRYDDGKGYFWINDLTEPYTIMKYHPISEALIGKEFKNEKYNVVGEDKKNFLSVLVGEVKKNGDGYVEYLWPKPNEEQNQPKLSYGKKIGTDLMIGTGFYIDDIEKKVAEKKEASKKAILTTIVLNIMTTLILLILGMVAMYVISKILCKRLGKVSDISYELADGDLTLKLEEDSKDEIGEMNKNLNVFIEKLKNMVTEIKDESKNIIENSDYNENRIAKWVGKYN